MSTRVALWIVVSLAVVTLAAMVAFPFLRGRRAQGQTAAAVSSAGPWYEIWFTTPRYPDRAADHHGGLDERLVTLVDSTRKTLDVAIYDFDLPDVAQAMGRAKGRGVAVRMVTDSDTAGQKDKDVRAALKTVSDAGIEIVEDKRGPIMHHKFVVSDGVSVLVGSWNFTVGDTYRLNNNTAVLRSPELAANFTNEFEKMFLRHQFGPTKSKDKPHPVVTIAGAKVETYFASEEDPSERIVGAIREARSKVDFLAFSFTQDAIADAMLERARAGVKVRGVFETTGSDTRFSEYNRLKQQGVEVYRDGNPYAMHHKVIVIDDHLTLFGSFNYSDNAAEENDEDLLVVDDPLFALPFGLEVGRMIALAQSPIKSR